MELASLAQLERCHRRHDQVMAELLDAARRFAAGRPDDGDLGRVRDAVAYFERAITRHFVDEEGSVFPRLSTRRPELAQALAELSAQHPAQIAMQAEVAAAARDLDGDARPNAGKTLLDAASRLADAHRAHVDREDAIFAAAHQALTAEDDAEIVAEMEMRRGREDERRGGGGGGGGGGGRGGGGGGRGGGGGGGGGGRGGGGGGGRGRAAASPADGPPSELAAPKSAARPRAKPAAKAPRRAIAAPKQTSATARKGSKPATRAAATAARPAARSLRAAAKPARRGKAKKR